MSGFDLADLKKRMNGAVDVLRKEFAGLRTGRASIPEYEFAIAFNPFITKPMKDILFDEKIAGSFHFTPGQAYDVYGNGNKSQIHWDMVCIQRADYGGGEIWFDGKLVRKDGLFVLPELADLNPDRLGAS